MREETYRIWIELSIVIHDNVRVLRWARLKICIMIRPTSTGSKTHDGNGEELSLLESERYLHSRCNCLRSGRDRASPSDGQQSQSLFKTTAYELKCLSTNENENKNKNKKSKKYPKAWRP